VERRQIRRDGIRLFHLHYWHNVLSPRAGAVLLGVHATTLNRAEGSESPSPGLIYGVELLRKQILQKEFDLDEFRKSRDRTLPRKKKK
jgi:Mu transposase, C-terminal